MQYEDREHILQDLDAGIETLEKRVVKYIAELNQLEQDQSDHLLIDEKRITLNLSEKLLKVYY